MNISAPKINATAMYKIDKNTKKFKNFTLLYREEDKDVSSSNLDVSFHVAIKPIAIFVQFLFLMPVCGIRSDSDKLVFKWISFRVIATLSYIIYGMFLTLTYFKEIYSSRINAINFVGLVFFSYTVSCTIIFLNIARTWPELMKTWAATDKNFIQRPYESYKLKLSTKIQITAGVIIVLAFIEHALYLINSAYNQYKYVKSENLTIDDPVEYFLKHQIGFLFNNVPFSVPFGIFNELINMTLTFGWNYMELFVMLVSLGLYTRFEQINHRIRKFCGKIVSEKLWISVHNDYVLVCELVEKVDYDLRYLILLSNLNNLYFICYQLLNIFDSLPYHINSIYFWYSLIYLFLRTIIAQFLAANIHDSSKYPIEVIKSIPPEGWCVEMQRISDEARTQTMALSGMKFFYLTRKSILGMLATIVTYELVLMQLKS